MITGRACWRLHLAAFCAVNSGLHALNFYTGRPWWALWPLLAWGVPLAAHYLVWRARNVDERWVEARTAELRLKSYDRGHIESIAERARDPGSAGDPRRAQGARD